MMIDATVTKARAYLKAGGSKQKLADAAKLHRNTLLNIERDDWSPTFSTVRALGDGLHKLKQRKGEPA